MKKEIIYLTLNDCMVTVYDNRLSPKLEEGDSVRVDITASVKTGNVGFVAISKEDYYLGIASWDGKNLELHPSNKEYETIKFDEEALEKVWVIGKCTQVHKDV